MEIGTIVDKIQKLLAMAEHPNSNEHEAAIALERAQDLLLRHNLSKADIVNTGTETPQGIGQLKHTEQQGYSWKRSLIHVLASANLCKVIGAPSEKAWTIFGSYDNVLAVLEMYNWITLQLVWIANREYRAYKNDEGTERGQSWKAGFYNGAIIAIKHRLAKPYDNFRYGTGKDLVLRNETALSEAIKKIFPHTVTSRRQVSGGNDGYGIGKRTGSTMNLTPSKQLGGTLKLKSG